MRRVYLDHSATTPLDPGVLEAMLPWMREGHGNASSPHASGRAARAAVEAAREQVAVALGVSPLDVLFTSGGTESDNQAVKGIAWAAREAGRGTHLVTSAIEHHAVLETCEWLTEHAGFTLTVVGCEPDGVVDPQRLLDAVRSDTVLVSVMAANNELGTVQSLGEIGPALGSRGVPLHTDAVQAFGRTRLEPDDWEIGALSLSAHKFNGPKGVGVLMLRRDLPAHPVLHGGGQERGVRSGTLHTAGIVGCGAATELAASSLNEEAPRQRALRDHLRDQLLAVGGVSLNGHPEARLTNNLNVAVTGCDGEALLYALDARGVEASTGSACQSGAAEPSHVLRAIGAPNDRAHLRLTLGRTTTPADVEHAAAAFREAVKLLRDAGGGFV
ncbi:MAG: aminotransferase class V-fold PLP-dependent enzyme [Nitriliruptorales bacterium]|nr:aminotransferase class V-fold PLP-dependent enzyme [Nitriliruptorales bacterium]